MAGKDNVIKMRRMPSLNVGVIIFLIIIIYMAFNLFSYLTSSPVAEYEVGQGTIATNHVYRGLIIRDETVVYAGQSGYINYYIKNGQKVSLKNAVSIDVTYHTTKKPKYYKAPGSDYRYYYSDQPTPLYSDFSFNLW